MTFCSFYRCRSVQALSQIENSLFEWLCEAMTSNLRHGVSWQRPRVAIKTHALCLKAAAYSEDNPLLGIANQLFVWVWLLHLAYGPRKRDSRAGKGPYGE
jgi:hypothetical protein